MGSAEVSGAGAGEGEVAVDVQNVTFVYPDGTVALRGVNLRIERGEFLAFIGQNGSGKTTLSKVIAGLLKPTEGRALVFGMDTREAKTSYLATKVGYIFQNPDHQLFNDTVYNEVAYGPRNLKLPPEEVEERVREAMRIAGLSDEYREEHPFFLSKGLRQRVAIASILAMRPSVIIVDEPTTGQDFKQSIEIMDFLTDLNRQGYTIIIITHDMPIVARYARRTVVMADGEILMDAPTRKVFEEAEVLERAFIKPPQITLLADALADLGAPRGALTPWELVEWVRGIAGESGSGRVKEINKGG